MKAQKNTKTKTATTPVMKGDSTSDSLKSRGSERQELMDMALDQNDDLTVKDVMRMTTEQLRLAAGVKPKTPESVPEPKVTKAEKAPKADKGKDCLCGCGGRTKGGRYLPGHDAKHHAQLHPSKYAPKPCGCGCKDADGDPAMTKGGRFLPGHDARHYSALAKAEKAAAEAKANMKELKKVKKAA